MSGAPNPKPERRIVDRVAGTEKVCEENRCRACGLPGMWNRAHIVGKGQRGDDVPENIIPLCGSGTTGCHGCFDGNTGRASAPSLLRGSTREEVARMILLRPDEIEYALDKKGEDWLRARFAMQPKPTTA